ncbi:MAG TPA: hypothetical protein VF669_10615 [Tepidisphaeraceae bacterium]|jgi:hypothetical protein
MRNLAAFCMKALIIAAPSMALAAPIQFTGTFDPANNSGVTGTTTLTVDGDRLTVVINASGLEPNRNHAQHIHGFANGKQAQCPPPVLPPDIDLNKDGILQAPEAEIASGPPLVSLVMDPNTQPFLGDNMNFAAYPIADANGKLTYTQTFTMNPSVYYPLTLRVVELHGKTLNGAYDPELPVACAELAAVTSGGGNNGGGGNPVPLPAGVWAGIVTMASAGGVKTLKRLRRMFA